MSRFPHLTFRPLAATAIMAIATVESMPTIGSADSVTPKPGLAPQFRTWSVPMYVSGVSATRTWAANSYEIDTTDARPRVIAWYVARLKQRAMLVHKHSNIKTLPTEIAFDGGDYAIHFTILRSGTTIGVIKNE